MAAQCRSFFDDVRKELECCVCQEQFDENNEPKILKCLHTFCKSCLERWLRQQGGKQLSCPTCRQITECPNNNINSLPSNLFYKQMVGIVEAYRGKGREDSPQCGNCDQRRSLKFYCSDCNCFLCEECSMAHKKLKVFSGHQVKEIGNFVSSDAQDYARKLNVCKEHKDQVRFYCDQCVACICRDCAILEHRDHNFVSIDKGLDKKRSEIETKMGDVLANGSRLRKEKEFLKAQRLRMSESIEKAKEEVHRAAERNIALIRQHESSVTEQLINQKDVFEAEFSNAVFRMDERLTDVESGLEFCDEILRRNNLPEILNVEEILEQRFKELSKPSDINMKLNYSVFKYVPNDYTSISKSPGELLKSKTVPSLSEAEGKGLTEGTQGEDCAFKVITKDLQGKNSHSEIDEVFVDIKSTQTGTSLKVNIIDSNDGCYKVSYQPETAGDFVVSVNVDGEAIKKSPFQLKVREQPTRRKKHGKSTASTGTRRGQRNAKSKKSSQNIPSAQALSQDLMNGVKLSLYQSDITDEIVDAIVNAANEWLSHGGGVAAAIVRKGGHIIQEESDGVMAQRSKRPLRVSDAVHTRAGTLPCKFVIHTVGPRWDSFDKERCVSLLHLACIKSLHLAAQLELCSIALPPISSGIFGMPKDICAQVMFAAVEEFSCSVEAEFSTLREIRIVIIDDETINVFYEEFLKRYTSQVTTQTNAESNEVEPHSPSNISSNVNKPPLPSEKRSEDSQEFASKPSMGRGKGHHAIRFPDKPGKKEKPMAEANTWNIEPDTNVGNDNTNAFSSGMAVTEEGKRLADVHLTEAVSEDSNANHPSSTDKETDKEVNESGNQTLTPRNQSEEEEPPARRPNSNQEEIFVALDPASLLKMTKQPKMSYLDCALCMNQHRNPIYGCQCGHYFCNNCISCVIEKIGFCPQCSQEKLFPGNQPVGYMSWRTESRYSLPGYEECETIVLAFNFQGGIQGPDHTNPGERFSELFCSAYLPNNPAGVEVCNLLRRAFNGRLIFTIGRSPTTGENNKIVLNDIELKTSPTGGPTKCGYPDPSYLDRVKKQLADKGVTPLHRQTLVYN